MAKLKPFWWYRLLWWFLWPVVVFSQAAYRSGLLQRLGLVKYGSYDIVIHAASVGEAKIALWLRSYLSKKTKVLFCTSTPTGRSVILAANEMRDDHAYWPLDHSWIVKSWFKRVAMKHLVLVESELWPEACFQAKKNQIPIWVINARLSNRTFSRYQRFGGLIRQISSCVSGVFPESDQSAFYFKKLGFTVLNDDYVSLKWGQRRPVILDDLRRKILSIKTKPIVVVASTHPGEEQLIVQSLPTCLQSIHLVVIPRHPHRASKLKSDLAGSFIIDNSINAFSGIGLVAALGQLGTWFDLADVIIMGGSYVSIGGHNPIETAWSNAPVIVGHSVHNFQTIYTDLVNEGLVWPVRCDFLDLWLHRILNHYEYFKTKASCFVDYLDKNNDKVNRLGVGFEKMLT